MRALRALSVLAGIAVVALLPLYGDIRPQDAVSHPEWARMMLRGLDLLQDTPGINDTAKQAFATLSGRESRAWSAPQYVRAERVERTGGAGGRIRPAGGIGEAVYAFGVAQGGDYRLRLHMQAPAPAEAEFTEAGSDELLHSFSVEATPSIGWVDAGSLHLDPGAYEATVLLPAGSELEFVELAPPCTHPIEPRGGWKAASLASTEDVAVTVLQGLDLEDELPPAAPPLEYRGSDLQLEDGSPEASTEGAFRGGVHGARVVLVVDIPETGLYSLSVFGTAPGGQRWLADGCRTCLDLPERRPGAPLAQRPERRLPEGPALLLREPRPGHGRGARARGAEEGLARGLPRDARAARPRARRRGPRHARARGGSAALPRAAPLAARTRAVRRHPAARHAGRPAHRSRRRCGRGRTDCRAREWWRRWRRWRLAAAADHPAAAAGDAGVDSLGRNELVSPLRSVTRCSIGAARS